MTEVTWGYILCIILFGFCIYFWFMDYIWRKRKPKNMDEDATKFFKDNKEEFDRIKQLENQGKNVSQEEFNRLASDVEFLINLEYQRWLANQHTDSMTVEDISKAWQAYREEF